MKPSEQIQTLKDQFNSGLWNRPTQTLEQAEIDQIVRILDEIYEKFLTPLSWPMKEFIINEETDSPIKVQYDNHDVTIIDVRHWEDNSITLTRQELGAVIAKLLT